MAIKLTEKAAQEVKKIFEQNSWSVDDWYLRLGVKGGGCSGFSYVLNLTEDKNDNDEEMEIHGIRIICDPQSYLYLNDMIVDYKDEMMGMGFVFNNPNATGTCGCGSSFSV